MLHIPKRHSLPGFRGHAFVRSAEAGSRGNSYDALAEAGRRDGRLLGAELVIPAAEHMAHLLALAIGQNLTVHDLLRMPYYPIRPSKKDCARLSRHRTRTAGMRAVRSRALWIAWDRSAGLSEEGGRADPRGYRMKFKSSREQR